MAAPFSSPVTSISAADGGVGLVREVHGEAGSPLLGERRPASSSAARIDESTKVVPREVHDHGGTCPRAGQRLPHESGGVTQIVFPVDHYHRYPAIDSD